MAELTKRYFKSHGPATLKDFVWWSGLSVGDARQGLEMNKVDLIKVEIEQETYWLDESIQFPIYNTDSLYLLPAFDEFAVSYKDRSALLESTFTKTAITGNGIFKPIIVIHGQIACVWKRNYVKDSMVIEKILFSGSDKNIEDDFNRQAKRYAEFEGRNIGFFPHNRMS